MKTLNVNQIEKNRLSKKEMHAVSGGNSCGCGCHYASSGGSSTMDNGNANYDGNLWSKDSVIRIDGHTAYLTTPDTARSTETLVTQEIASLSAN